jgi:CCR4-NOT transcription complex subunit 2
VQVPECYRHNPPRLQPGYFSKFAQETLFYIFYSMPGDEAQVLAADELCTRGWAFHKEFKVQPSLHPNCLDAGLLNLSYCLGPL